MISIQNSSRKYRRVEMRQHIAMAKSFCHYKIAGIWHTPFQHMKYMQNGNFSEI